jgi:hypothetical protein
MEVVDLAVMREARVQPRRPIGAPASEAAGLKMVLCLRIVCLEQVLPMVWETVLPVRLPHRMSLPGICVFAFIARHRSCKHAFASFCSCLYPPLDSLISIYIMIMSLSGTSLLGDRKAASSTFVHRLYVANAFYV